MNSHSELPHRTRCREEENSNALSSPEQNTNKKKKKKNKGALNPQDPPPSTEPNAGHIQLQPAPKEKEAEKKEQPQVCPNPNPMTPVVATAIPIAAEKERGAEPNGATAEHPVSESTLQKRRRKKKKKNNVIVYIEGEPPNAMQGESEQKNNAKETGAEPSGVKVSPVQPQVCQKLELATIVETVTPVVQEKKECVELKETSVEQPQLCSKQELAPLVAVNPGKEKGVGPSGGAAENPQVCSKHELATKVVNPAGKENGVGKNEGAAEHPELVPVPDSTPSRDTPRKKKWKKKKKNVLSGQGIGSKVPNFEQLQLSDSKDPAIPIGVQPKIIGAGSDDANAERPPLCPEHEPEIPVDAEKKEVTGPNEASAENPRLLLPVSDPTPSKVTPQKRKWEKKGKNAYVLMPQGTETKESNNAGEPHVCSKPMSAPPIDPQHVIPMGPEIPTEPEQQLSKKKRKKKKRKNALKNDVAETNKHNDKPSEIPVQISICPIAASQTDQTIPIDQKPSINPATPVDPEQKMAKKKKRKKHKSTLKSEGSEFDKHNTESTAKVPVSKCNAEPPANTQIRRTKGLQVTKIPFKRHGESSMRCRSCQQPGHKFKNCPRVKCIPDDEEICFFCGEIGHSLGKCSVSKAGGGRFARCLFCYAQGHFTSKCPHNCHGIDAKGVAANGPIDKTAEAEGKPIAVAEVTNSEQG